MKLTGIKTKCKICENLKDDVFFKYQKGKRAGLVCRACDLEKKKLLYKNSEKERTRAKLNAKIWRESKPEYAKQISKQWREKNKTEIKRKRKQYHLKNADQINEKTRKWYIENKERHNANSKLYNSVHQDKLAKLKAKYYQDNKLRLSKQNNEWRRKNKKLANSYVRQYNIAKINRTPAWANIEAIQEFYKNCPEGYEVDHIHPLQGKLISGFHIVENLQYLEPHENRTKQRKFKPYRMFYEPSGIRIEII